MPVRPLILLPPSEGKAPGGEGPPWAPDTLVLPELDRARAQVLRALGRSHPARRGPTIAAIDRYTGVLYKELAASTLPAAHRRRLDDQVLIASGLWGFVAPPDPIPEYKLKMGASIAPLGKLSTWWRPRLTGALAPRVAGAVVWDLLPNEHAAALDWSRLTPRTRITVRFVDADDRVVSHWNKLLKGSLVRWLVAASRRTPDQLDGFEHPLGYRLDPAATEVDGPRVSVVLRQQA